MANIKTRLSDLADDVLEGRQDKGVAAVASQVLNVCLRAIELERKIREAEEIEERITVLEDLAKAKPGGRSRWGT